MRDPARIDPLIELLRSVWHDNPDLRLGQLVGGAAGLVDPYYTEDKDLAEGLRRFPDLTATTRTERR